MRTVTVRRWLQCSSCIKPSRRDNEQRAASHFHQVWNCRGSSRGTCRAGRTDFPLTGPPTCRSRYPSNRRRLAVASRACWCLAHRCSVMKVYTGSVPATWSRLRQLSSSKWNTRTKTTTLTPIVSGTSTTLRWYTRYDSRLHGFT